MAEIIQLRPSVAALMEGDLRAIDGFADALALVSETMDESPHAINGLIGKSSTASSAQRDAAF
jgi:hypothetical protein